MSATLESVDRGAVIRSAAITLAILVPPVVILRALLGSADNSRVWGVIPLVFVASFLAGGAIAARLAPPDGALKHGALTGALAFGVALAFAVARNLVSGWSMGIAALVTAVLFWQVATGLATLGALLAVRRRNKEVGSL